MVTADLAPVVRGWANYYGVADCYYRFRTLDAWIRMRLRAFKLKRRCCHDNWRIPDKRLRRWGFLSLLSCRPTMRLSSSSAYTQVERPTRLLETRNLHGVAQCVNGTR